VEYTYQHQPKSQ